MNAETSLAVREGERALDAGRRFATVHHNDLKLEARVSEGDFWVVFYRGREGGGVAWRTPLFTEDARIERVDGSGLAHFVAISHLGRHRIDIEACEGEAAFFTLTVRFRPDRALHVPFIPRDLVAVGPDGRAHKPKGRIEARQRRLNTGLCYFELREPDLGKVLYVQDLTALNPYFEATGTKPENAVGGEWPEVGYLAPTQPQDTGKALPGGREIVLNRAFLMVRRFPQDEEAASAWQFLDMLGAIYRRIKRPNAAHRDWIERTGRTLDDLRSSPKARTKHLGHTYFHPYTVSENPDSMVQLSLLSAIHDWGRWSGKRDPLEREIRNGLAGFHDRELQTLRRYLPDVSKDKDADAVDSWYLYHPMAMLAHLALDGEEDARELFFATVDYGIKAARHFKYRWPIQYKIDTFEVITAVAADDRGQTDVGGMYAWVMLQAFQLSGEGRFLDEARAAIDAAEGMRFDLNYQANLTAWGAAACIKLWRITGEKRYLTQSYVYLASFFHNSQMWNSDIGIAKEYSNFMAVTCLQDAPYMAIYECFDSFAAFEQYLDLGGPDLIPAVRLLVNEYCRYALDRAWYYYPDALPEDGVAKDNIRNGHIDRALSFPVEDLYPDGQPAGQVGQEIYGAGAAMVFATRAFHRIEGAGFLLYCDHFVRTLTRIDEKAVSFSLDGPTGSTARISLAMEASSRRAPGATLRGPDGKPVAPSTDSAGVLCRFEVPAQGAYTLSW
ncbi:hypothetical protein ACWPM1_03885 [Tsuneonella sp. HG249]